MRLFLPYVLVALVALRLDSGSVVHSQEEGECIQTAASGDDGGSTRNDGFDAAMPEEGGLLVLTQDNFNYALQKQQDSAILVVLYAPWCDHSQPLLEKMEDTARLLREWEWGQRQLLQRTRALDNPENYEDNYGPGPVELPDQLNFLPRTAPRLAKVDATVETALAEVFSLAGYPTLKLIIPSPGETGNGEALAWDIPFSLVDYNGAKEKSPHDLLQFVIHYWSRYPSPVFDVKGGARGMQNFLSWVEDGRRNPSMHNPILRDTSAGSSEGIVFVQCRRPDRGDVLDGRAPCEVERYDDTYGEHVCYRRKDSASIREIIGQSREALNANAEYMRGSTNVYFVSMSSDCEALGMDFDGEVRVIVTPTEAHVDEQRGLLVMENNDFAGATHDPMVITNWDETLHDFIERQSLPLLLWFSRESLPVAFGTHRQVHVSLFVEEDSEVVSSDTNLALAAMKMAAVRHRRMGYVFMIIPSGEHRIVDYFGVRSFPSVLITDNRKGGMSKFFLGTEQLTDELAIHRFVSQFNAGMLRPLLKSEPVSENDAAAPVKVVRGWSFESMVMKSNRHSLVNFFSPWCGHSKHLGPKWNDLANLVKILDWDVDVMKMDATENEVDHPKVDILSFPTIYYFPLGNKTNPLRYDGKRSDAEDFVTWLFHHGLQEESLLADRAVPKEPATASRQYPVQ